MDRSMAIIIKITHLSFVEVQKTLWYYRNIKKGDKKWLY